MPKRVPAFPLLRSVAGRPRAAAWYGWVADTPDTRDEVYVPPVLPRLVPVVNLKSRCPNIYNQGAIGSCVAQAVAALLSFHQKAQGLSPLFLPSRLFLYYNARLLIGTEAWDSGCQIRDGIKTAGREGAPTEKIWPHYLTRFARLPSAAAYRNGVFHPALEYRRVLRDLTDMQTCLATGHPIIVGFTVYESFESEAVARTGVVPMPKPPEAVIGAHAILLVGYDTAARTFFCRNSWGTGWGQKGYFTMPFQYFENENLSDDFWTITLIK